MTTEWHTLWREGNLGFHSASVHRDLIAHEHQFLGDRPRRVLVPLCGKTVDLAWLADRGHEVIGVELVAQAVDELFAALGQTPEVQQQGALTVFRWQRITILCGDIFDVSAADAGPVDRIWDRAALVALPAEVRRRYARHVRTLAAPGAVQLLNAFEYDTAVMEGPPFSVPDAEVRELYAPAQIDVLEQRDAIAEMPRWRELGHRHWHVRSYLIALSG